MIQKKHFVRFVKEMLGECAKNTGVGCTESNKALGDLES